MTFGHPLLGERRVEAVEAENDDTPGARATQRFAPSTPAKHEADRPQQHRENAGSHRSQQCEERSDQREARTRSDVCMGRIRCDERCAESGRRHDQRQRRTRDRCAFLAIAIELAVDDLDHAIDVQPPAEEGVEALGKGARTADRFVVADREKFHVALDLHENPDVGEVPLVVLAGLGVFDRVGLLAPLQHHVLRLQHFAEIALAQDHLVVVLVRQRLQQVRDHLDRLAARLAQPRLVRLLRQALDALDLEVAQRIVFVGLPLAVGRHCDAAGLEHAHHHRRAGAGQTRDYDDGSAELQAPAQVGKQIAHSTYPSAFRCSSVSGSNS